MSAKSEEVVVDGKRLETLRLSPLSADASAPTIVMLHAKFRNWNIGEFLAPITCPTLVIQGEQDQYGTLTQVAAIKNRVSHAKTLILPRCGHWPHRDHPAAVLDAITNFLSSDVS